MWSMQFMRLFQKCAFLHIDFRDNPTTKTVLPLITFRFDKDLSHLVSTFTQPHPTVFWSEPQDKQIILHFSFMRLYVVQAVYVIFSKPCMLTHGLQRQPNRQNWFATYDNFPIWLRLESSWVNIHTTSSNSLLELATLLRQDSQLMKLLSIVASIYMHSLRLASLRSIQTNRVYICSIFYVRSSYFLLYVSGQTACHWGYQSWHSSWP